MSKCLANALVWFFLLLIGFGLFEPSIGAATNQIHSPYRTDRIIIQPKEGQRLKDIDGLHARRGYRVLKTFPALNHLQVVSLPAGKAVDEAIAEYQQSGLVEFAEPDYLMRAFSSSPDDPRFVDGTLWGLWNQGQGGGIVGADIEAVGAWNVLNSASNIIVAVVDSGVRYTHEDLAENMWVNTGEIPGNGIDDDHDGYIDDVHGINALTGSGDPMDAAGHGTHVAGILGAVGNNGKGTVGVAWKVQIMACRFMNDAGEGSNSDAIECIDYARLHGASIINASWGGGANSTALRSAIGRAQSSGIIFVAAAGNDGTDNDVTPNYPAGYDFDNIVSVASVTRTDTLSDFSNFGAQTVDLAAPGTAIYSTWKTSDASYAYLSGTSMAAPYVSGALALMRSQFPADSYKQIINRLLAATDPVAGLSGKCVTGGRLNLQRALEATLIANFTADHLSGTVPLAVEFQDTSLGSVIGWKWDFGDGSPAVQERNPAHQFLSDGNFTVTLTVTGEGGAASVKSRIITGISNYKMASTNFAWIDPSAMTRVVLTDNGVSSRRLPFPFVFYGQTYEQFYIGANGVIGFKNQNLSTTSNTDLPNGTTPNAIICPYWDNLNPMAGGSVYFGTEGESPNRRAVISWMDVPRNSTPTAALTFQTVLSEDSNGILFQYLEVQPTTSRGAGKGASVGLENETGTIAVKYTVDGVPKLLTNQQAIVFLPPNSAGIVVDPLGGALFSADQGGVFNPSQLSYSIENRTATNLRWAVTKTQDWLNLSATNGTLASGEQVLVTVTPSEAAYHLKAGAYLDTLVFSNLESGKGNTTRTVSLEMNGTAGYLTVAPESGFSASGPAGGPFDPSSQVYTLLNTGDARLDWTLEGEESWVSASSSGGTLAAGASTTVTISLNESAALLPEGSVTAPLFFKNTSNGLGSGPRPVVLDIRSKGRAKLAVLGFGFDGELQFRLSGEMGRTYQIESSTNLLDWSVVSTNIVGDSGSFEFIDLRGNHFLRNFYRAVAQ